MKLIESWLDFSKLNLHDLCHVWLLTRASDNFLMTFSTLLRYVYLLPFCCSQWSLMNGCLLACLSWNNTLCTYFNIIFCFPSFAMDELCSLSVSQDNYLSKQQIENMNNTVQVWRAWQCWCTIVRFATHSDQFLQQAAFYTFMRRQQLLIDTEFPDRLQWLGQETK